MFIETLKKHFKENEPIFTNEILDIFNEYSRGYVFRLIDIYVYQDKLIKFSNGIYYLPKKTIVGTSTITVEDVIKKKYLKYKQDTYGIYSGLSLQNMFSLSTQIPNTIEIVTNKEATRCRKITIDKMNIILRKSRCKINKKNANAYTVLQLFTEIENVNVLDVIAKANIKDFIKNNNISNEDLFSLAAYFPAKTTKNLMCSGVIC